MNFGSALGELFEFDTGRPLESTSALIRESLGFGSDIVPVLGSGNLGQYEPAGGGENTTSGFVGKQPFNPVDFIFLLEGAVLFSGAATRRLGSNKALLNFPFTVGALTVGSGATASIDDQNSAEFWAPIWTRPACLSELSAFLTEGRTAVNGKITKDGLEFAVAVSTLGSQRGVPEYQRFALLQREPRNPKKATPLGRVHVRGNPRASLVSELDAGGWLSRARSAVRNKNAPAVLGKISRKLDEALFRLAGDGSVEAVQQALIAIGALMLEVGRRPKLRESLPPPPRLSEQWVHAANDGSHEFVLAEAVASLNGTAEDFRLPFRRHLVPLDWPKDRECWSNTTESKAVAVWTGRNFGCDMASVLERRLIEAQRRNFTNEKIAEIPLRGRRAAPLAAVAAFLAERTDNDHIAALAAGLAWARSRTGASAATEREDALPFAYAALKPLFVPEGVRSGSGEERLLGSLPLVRLIRAGRVATAVMHAQRMMRGAGLPTPFAHLETTSALDANRLIAALLFPIAPMAHGKLIARVYPDLTNDREEYHAA